ncbi:MAG: class II fructose-bisphosphatase, partial [Anaerolineales bacterium]|nr:class II fructose-bisphosphatase [Anaerolineales bacterium]
MEVLGATPTRNLALELARVTEAAAMLAGRFMGRGDKEGADQAAVNAMRLVLSTVDMNGVIVIGEGEKDSAPMLFNGEKVGNGSSPDVDVAVDPIDGTRPLAFGRSNSLAMVALAPRGTMFDPGPFLYMNKMAVGPEAKGVINIEKPITENLQAIAKAKGKAVEDLTTIILDRPRHDDMVAEIRKCGARIRQIPDGDVAAALMTSWPDTGVDVLLGIGGTPEGV